MIEFEKQILPLLISDDSTGDGLMYHISLITKKLSKRFALYRIHLLTVVAQAQFCISNKIIYGNQNPDAKLIILLLVWPWPHPHRIVFVSIKNYPKYVFVITICYNEMKTSTGIFMFSVFLSIPINLYIVQNVQVNMYQTVNPNFHSVSKQS